MRLALLAAAWALAVPVGAACPTDAEVAAFAESWRAGAMAAPMAKGGTMADALCAQDRFVQRLVPHFGRPVGYKAAFTSKAAQAQFGVAAPIHGVLLKGMMHANGATLSSDGLLYEADLIVVVRDAGINDARSPAEVIRHVSAIIPFIELPGPGMAADELTAVTIAAANASARAGVLGAPIAVGAETDPLVAALGALEVVMTDQAGTELARGAGAAILGHPLNAVVFLADALRARGQALKPGDLLSLGSLTRVFPAKPGQGVSVRYHGLPGTPTVSVRFAP